MNKIILEQLNKVKVADLSDFDTSKTTFTIPQLKMDRFEEDKYYLIELDNSLLINNPESLLQCNWNKGSYPTCKYLKIDVEKVMGKMIKVNGIGYDIQTNNDLSYMWSGWLTIDLIKIIEKL